MSRTRHGWRRTGPIAAIVIFVVSAACRQPEGLNWFAAPAKAKSSPDAQTARDAESRESNARSTAEGDDPLSRQVNTYVRDVRTGQESPPPTNDRADRARDPDPSRRRADGSYLASETTANENRPAANDENPRTTDQSSSQAAPQVARANASTRLPESSMVDRPPPNAPPRIASVSVSAAPPRPAADEERSSAIHANRSSHVPGDTERRERATALEQRVSTDPNDLDAQFRLRMQYLIEGRDTLALQPTPGMTAERQALVSGMTRLMLAARSSAGRDPALWANRQLEALESLSSLIRDQADLQVPRVAFCTRADGFGVYDVVEPAEFVAGRPTPILVYVEVENLRYEATDDDRHRARLTARLAILDRQGQEVWTHDAGDIADVCRHDRRDFFVALMVEIPSSLNPGQYTLKATVTDQIGRKSNENQTTFRLIAR
ncbi:MAG: hypothetical protein V3T70_02470 [Phycisphaerae bacterium]